MPWLGAVWMSPQLWWLLRGVANCGACDVVLAHRLGSCRGLGIVAVVGGCRCRRCLVAWRSIEESFLTANGNKALVSFSECQCPRGSMGTLCYKWGGGGWLSTIVNLCSTCTDRLLEGMTTQHAVWRIDAAKQDVSAHKSWSEFFPRCLLNMLSSLETFVALFLWL